MDAPASSRELQNLYRRIQPEMRRERPNPDAIAAAMEAVQRLTSDVDAEDATEDTGLDLATGVKTLACQLCGYRNRQGNRFCGRCGATVEDAEKTVPGPRDADMTELMAVPPNVLGEPERLPTTGPTGT